MFWTGFPDFAFEVLNLHFRARLTIWIALLTQYIFIAFIVFFLNVIKRV